MRVAGESQIQEFMMLSYPANDKFYQFCSVVFYDRDTGECLETYTVDLSKDIYKTEDNTKSRTARFRSGKKQKVVTPGQSHKPFHEFYGIARSPFGDPMIQGIANQIEIRAILNDPRFAEQTISILTRQDDHARYEIKDRPTHSSGAKTDDGKRFSDRFKRTHSAQDPHETSISDPAWGEFKMIITRQNPQTLADITRLRRVAALLFHADARAGRHRPDLDKALASANEHLDILERTLS